jgi:cystinosin
VAFAVHAFLLSSFTLGQIAYYDGLWSNPPSKTILLVVAILISIILLSPAVAVIVQTSGLLRRDYDWLDYLYLLSYIKIFISFIKYVPQVILNLRRKSTVGWSIWQILLDLTGGILSDIQLIGDCVNLKDWTAIQGNLPKLMLGMVSIMFDSIFITQHYILYPDEASLHRTAVEEEAVQLDRVQDDGNPLGPLLNSSA